MSGSPREAAHPPRVHGSCGPLAGPPAACSRGAVDSRRYDPHGGNWESDGKGGTRRSRATAGQGGRPPASPRRLPHATASGGDRRAAPRAGAAAGEQDGAGGARPAAGDGSARPDGPRAAPTEGSAPWRGAGTVGPERSHRDESPSARSSCKQGSGGLLFVSGRIQNYNWPLSF